MTNVSFDEEQTYQAAPIASSQPYFVRLVINWGLAKDQKGAEKFLIGVVVAAVVMAIAVPLLMREKEITLSAPVVPLPFEPGQP